MEESMSISVKKLANGGMLAPEFTCDGKDSSPELSWKNIPENSETLVIILEDPDASVKTPEKPLFCHWITYNIPASMEGLSAGFPKVTETKGGIKQGVNDFNKTGYGGPCPRSGEHRYFFKLFALDCALDMKPEAVDWKAIYKAMKGHIIDTAEFMGRYQRQT